MLVERLKGALEEASATAGALLQEEQHVVGRRIRVPAKESLADMASEDLSLMVSGRRNLVKVPMQSQMARSTTTAPRRLATDSLESRV